MRQPKHILVIRFSAIGDVVLTTPVLRMLKKRFPEARIDFLVKSDFADLIETHPAVDRVWRFDPLEDAGRLIRALRKQNYDGLADLQSSLRSRWFAFRIPARRKVRFSPERWKRFLLVHLHRDRYGEQEAVPLRYLNAVRPWGVRDDGQGAELFVDPAAESSLSRKMEGIDPSRPILLMAPGAGRATKRWLPERFSEAGRHFSENGYQVLLIGGALDIDVCEDVRRGMGMPESSRDLSGALALNESLALIRRARMLVTNDTGVMHMAAAVGTPVTAIFGPTTRQLGFFPFRADSAVIEKSLKCRPCSYHGTADCAKGHFRCMREIASRDVIRAAESLLKRESR